LQGVPHNRSTLFVVKQPKGGLAGPLFWSVTALLAVALLIVPAAGAETVPAGFQARKLPILKSTEASAPKYINGLTRPTTIAFGPDGKMYVGEWLGRVKVFDSVEDTTPTLSVDIATEVHTFGDRGLLGMKLDPEFGQTGHNFIYLSYAYDVPMNPPPGAEPHAEFSDGGDNCKNESPYTDCLISGKVVRIALNPTTGIAVGGAAEPPQQALVQSWCQQFNSHSMGDLEFDSSGALLVSGGEGANYAESDYGQFSNPCGDPVNAGGSLRAQDVREGGDQTDYSGSMIRIDPETGEALPDNPLHASSDVRARRILAFGFRNPFRFTIRPGTDEIYVGDVGQATWEELDRLTSPPASGQGALNFGWPCYEGGNGANAVMGAWQAFASEGHAPLCQALYANPSLVTAPLWSYGHGIPNGYLFPGDACDPSPGSAYSGLAFYDPTGVPPSVAFPAKYQGALFMADAARGCIWVMGAGSDGRPNPADITNFAVGDGAGKISPVDLVQGPDGALYAPNFYNESIEQIRYFGANEPPLAKLDADKVDGALVGGELTVHFDASSSSDKEGDSFSYEWDLDGDGQFDDGSDQPTEEWTYTNENDVTVRLRVKDEFGRTDQTALQIYPGDLGPPTVPTIEAPTTALDWTVGDTIAYAGSASDPDGGPLTYKWRISIQHCPQACHEHPYFEPEGASGAFTAPPHEEPSHLSFVLTATDDRDRSTRSAQLEIYPHVGTGGGGAAPPETKPPAVVPKVRLSIVSRPPGIKLQAGKSKRRAPFAISVRKGTKVALKAPAKASKGKRDYRFKGWLIKGKLKRKPALSVVGRAPGRYVAVYAAD
jgi:glucose/arabinose dehydrogenase